MTQAANNKGCFLLFEQQTTQECINQRGFCVEIQQWKQVKSLCARSGIQVILKIGY